MYKKKWKVKIKLKHAAIMFRNIYDKNERVEKIHTMKDDLKYIYIGILFIQYKYI